MVENYSNRILRALHKRFDKSLFKAHSADTAQEIIIKDSFRAHPEGTVQFITSLFKAHSADTAQEISHSLEFFQEAS